MVRGAIPKDNCHTYCHKKHQHLHLSANVFWLPNVKQNIWQRDFKDTNFLEVKTFKQNVWYDTIAVDADDDNKDMNKFEDLIPTFQINN